MTKRIKAALEGFLLLAIGTGLIACDTDIDLISEEGDVSVVYAILDPDQPVQKFKINKTFVGEQDATVLAKDPSSFNYQEGDIDVIVEGYYQGTLKQTLMATRTEHNPKSETTPSGGQGIFTTENNVLYEVVTDSPDNTIYPSYNYKVKISNNLTGEQISGETEVIDNFQSGFLTTPVASSSISLANGRGAYFDFVFEWTTVADAKRYELYLLVHYRETSLSGTTDTSEIKTMQIYIGEAVAPSTKGAEKLSILYNGESFYQRLNTEFSKKEPRKWLLEPLSLRFVVGGDDLNTYIAVNQPSVGIVQERPEYTNVTNGLGIISSRREFIFGGYYLNSFSIKELVGGIYTKGSGLNFCFAIRNSSPPSYQCN